MSAVSKGNCREGSGLDRKTIVHLHKTLLVFGFTLKHWCDRGETGRVTAGQKHECQCTLTLAMVAVKQQQTLFLTACSCSPASHLECMAWTLAFTQRASTGNAADAAQGWRSVFWSKCLHTVDRFWTNLNQNEEISSYSLTTLTLELPLDVLKLTVRTDGLSTTPSCDTGGWHNSWLSQKQGGIRLNNLVSRCVIPFTAWHTIVLYCIVVIRNCAELNLQRKHWDKLYINTGDCVFP